MKNFKLPVGVAAIPLVLLALSACTSNDATSERSNKPTRAAVTVQEYDTAIAGCLRDKGLDVKDPGPGGGLGIGQPVGMSQDTYDGIVQGCQSTVEKKYGARPGSENQKQNETQAVTDYNKFASCLREAGYDMPDVKPGSDGVPAIGGKDASGKQIDNQAFTACATESGVGAPATRS